MNDDSEIGRYFILGSIDGLLAVLGIIVGVSTTSANATIIIKAALGGGIALCLTNGIGTYLAETAVQYGKISAVEKAILQDLRHTKIEQIARRKIIRDSIIHGGASLIGAIVPITPFLLLDRGIAVYVSVILSLLALVFLGGYSGRISKQSYLRSIIRMVSLGALIVLICSLLGVSG
ncbi:hypothetical protein CUJ83_08920 [Methanocella sp. CWC-04]|uniref:TIGR00267 family protein n=1 Tax=Methanooceanicella nereidis TaxID=2052831 RepID=A0AAP2RD42_9EURY|nr:VIT1/CCC1 transporter family protein [Methanocella sp. CWC-04]MCD1295118.1 hypothetical protein [Methanocella sp. CWC-04]